MVRVAVRSQVIDRGFDAQVRNQQRLARRGVKVGIQAAAGSQDGVSLLDILIFNEFGTRTIPARPVMRSYADTYGRQIVNEAQNAATFMMRTGHIDMGLNRLGAYMQSGLQAHWRASKSWAAPNAEYTIMMKGSDVPLIDKGVLINAVRYQVI